MQKIVYFVKSYGQFLLLVVVVVNKPKLKSTLIFFSLTGVGGNKMKIEIHSILGNLSY